MENRKEFLGRLLMSFSFWSEGPGDGAKELAACHIMRQRLQENCDNRHTGTCKGTPLYSSEYTG